MSTFNLLIRASISKLGLSSSRYDRDATSLYLPAFTILLYCESLSKYRVMVSFCSSVQGVLDYSFAAETPAEVYAIGDKMLAKLGQP